MDSKYTPIFEYFRQCPLLAELWSVAATEDVGIKVILPQGASPAVSYEDGFDTLGNYICEVIPYPSLYEDFEINCYQYYDANDSNEPQYNVNVLNLDEVRSICDWVKEQNDKKNFPVMGEDVVSIECNPFVPQLRYYNPQENTVAYFITVRIRYVNKTYRRETIEYEYTD